MDLTPGIRLGPYEILSPLGAGGMGEVYRARDTRLGRDVAIKVLPQHLTATPDARARFDREARAISKLNHPNICTLHDVGREGDTDFIVLELLEGETLAARLTRGPLPLKDLLPVARQIAAALDRAHRAGLLHRDIKPGNIMLARDGAKLLDFGLAKADASAYAGPAYATSTRAASEVVGDPATGEGTIAGTLGYMAPERLEGHEADARSEVFSLGTVLYEMATGRPAFTGKSAASVIAAILGSEPEPLSSLMPASPPALDHLIRTCLAKDPDSRRQTMRDVAIDLEWIAGGGSSAAIPVVDVAEAKRRRIGRIAGTAALVALAGATMLYVGRSIRRPREPEPVRFTIPTPEAIQESGEPRISPDGRYIAFSGKDSTGTSRIWLRPMNSLNAEPVPGTEGAGRPFWSPDSRHLAFTAGTVQNHTLKKVDLAGGQPVTICAVPDPGDGNWGTSGVILVDGLDSIRAVNAAGGVAVGAASIDRSRGETINGWPQFLPDGRHFLFLGYDGVRPDSVALRLGRLGTTESRVLAIGRFSRFEYVPPGFILYVNGRTLMAQPFDVKGLRFSGQPFPVVEPVGARGRTAPDADFSASATGTLVTRGAGVVGGRRLVWKDRAGRALGKLGAVADYAGVALSPDGRQVATSFPEPISASHEIWLIDVERDVATRFTFHPADDGWPVWSADGRTVYFGSNRSGLYRVYGKPRNATGDERELPLPPVSVGPRDASRDGRLLACAGYGSPATQWDVFMVTLGAEPRLAPIAATRLLEWEPAISPDGKWVAYTSFESGRREAYVVSYPSLEGKWRISTDGGWDPQWSANGGEIFFLEQSGALMSAAVTTAGGFRVATPKHLFNVDPPGRYPGARNYAVSADGQRFLVKELAREQASPPMGVILDWPAALGRK
jgi:Tol biopolymer transport system component